MESTGTLSDSLIPKSSTSAPAGLLPQMSSPVRAIHTNGHTSKPRESLPNLSDMDAKCGGCRKVIEQESGGVVVAFG